MYVCKKKKSAGSLPGPPSPTACVMLHGQENLKESVACKKFKKNVCMYVYKKENQQVACRGLQAQQPVSCCMARKN
jgi:hypothetical protein